MSFAAVEQGFRSCFLPRPRNLENSRDLNPLLFILTRTGAARMAGESHGKSAGGRGGQHSGMGGDVDGCERDYLCGGEVQT